ncbi:hypothetical protein N7527_003711 [Penicillium freii]|nr:hypothetical protein N7527_003711 [Penicillium freii]
MGCAMRPPNLSPFQFHSRFLLPFPVEPLGEWQHPEYSTGARTVESLITVRLQGGNGSLNLAGITVVVEGFLRIGRIDFQLVVTNDEPWQVISTESANQRISFFNDKGSAEE